MKKGFNWAVEQCLKHLKVKRPCFHEGVYVAFVNTELYLCQGNDKEKFVLDRINAEAIDWEIYEEPKINLYHKIIAVSPEAPYFYEHDVEEAIQEFMKELGIYECIVPQNLNTDKVLCALKRKFGKELLE